MITFTLGGDSVTFSRNPARGGYARRYDYQNPAVENGSGDRFVVDKNLAALKTIDLAWAWLPATEVRDLEEFIENVTGGAAQQFVFADLDGSQWYARFLPDTLVTAPVLSNRESASVSIVIEAEFGT